MAKSKLARYHRYYAARRLAERLEKAYPGSTFCATQSIDDHTWMVAKMKEDKIVAYVERPTGPLPGEPGHVKLQKWSVLYTDRIGPEPKFSWRHTADIFVPDESSSRVIMRKAKAAIGLTGRKGTTHNDGRFGEVLEFRPFKMLTVLFVTYEGMAIEEPPTLVEGTGKPLAMS